MPFSPFCHSASGRLPLSAHAVKQDNRCFSHQIKHAPTDLNVAPPRGSDKLSMRVCCSYAKNTQTFDRKEQEKPVAYTFTTFGLSDESLLIPFLHLLAVASSNQGTFQLNVASVIAESVKKKRIFYSVS